MPSVRARRSTRVFVPKTVAKTHGRPSSLRALRSFKNEDWLISSFLTDSSEPPWLGGDGGCSGPDSPETCAHVAPEIDTAFQKMFGNVYYRKRRKGLSTPETPTPAETDHRKYGIVFKRNKQRKKSKLNNELPQEVLCRLDLEAERQKLLDAEFTSPVALIGDSADAGCSGAKIDVYVNLSLENTDSSSLVNSPESLSEASFFSNLKCHEQIQQRRKDRVMDFPNSSFLNSVEPIHVKPLSFRDSDFLSLREELNDASSPLWSYHKHRKSSKKTTIERIRELKAALAEVKLNKDRIICHANILVFDTICCWREARADVTLQQDSSSDWCIAVKVQGSTRYTFKAQEMRPSVVNRYTHACMWSVEDGWKLEFTDRWDWLVFKEMHAECRERNERNVHEAPPRIIPIPGITEVPSYSKDPDPSFVRPHAYIRVTVDEVERAMNGEIAYYDMDSADDEWLEHLNSNSFGESGHISEEKFEKIIFAFERELYDTSDEFVSKERVLDLCENIAKRDLVAAVYDYWLKKRNKKQAGGVPLVRIFQAPQSKRSQVIPKHFLRKKRSFKRQRSQVERSQVVRGKSEILLQDMMMEEAKQHLLEAETSAKSAMESAGFLRSRAQMLNENADMAVYKSVMALKIAEALRFKSPDDNFFFLS